MTGLAPDVDALHAQVHASLRALPDRYLPAHAPPGERRYRLEIAGCAPHVVMVRGRRCVVRPATDGRVDVTVRIGRRAWLDLMDGLASGPDAFLDGTLRIAGDLNEALRLETLFAAPAGTPRAAAPARVRLHELGDGATVETYETGPPDAPAVVLLHGLGASKVSLLPLIAGLAGRHRVIALDFPGFGKSRAPWRARYDLPDLVRWTAATLDAAGVERAAVVGNSLGGRVALELALTEPARVSSLGLLCPAVAFDEYALMRPLLALPFVASLPSEAAALSRWPLSAGAVDAGLRRMFADPTRVPADNLVAARDEFLRTLRLRRHRRALLAVARHLAADVPRSFWSRLEALAAPSLWVFGDTDRLVAASYAQPARRVPGARVEVWASCGHVPQFEHPERTLAALETHVTGRS